MKHKTFPLSVFILLLAICAGAQPLIQPGMPDSTFGANGRILTQNQASDNIGYGDFALQPDGKIVAFTTGFNYRSRFYYHFILTRFNADGTLDTGFGEGGTKYYPIETEPAQNVYGKSIHLQPDGKIIIAGTFAGDFLLLRVNPNGDLDYGFGINGMVKTNFAGFEEISVDWLRGVIIRPDGKILAYGQSEFDRAMNPCTPSTPCYPWQITKRIAIAQYNPDGWLDTSFGINGLQKFMFSNSTDTPRQVFLQPDGKLLLSGALGWIYECCGGMNYESYPVLIRYTAEGKIDRDFGRGGYLETQDFSDFYEPLPDGKFLGVTFCNGCNWNYYNIKIVRYNSDLTRDASFVEVRHYLQTNELSAVKVQPDGKIILSTYEHSFNNPVNNPKSTIYRFNPNGNTDFSFGINGAVKFDLDDSDKLGSIAFKALVQPDGKIVIGSLFYPSTGSGTKGIILARLLGGNGNGRRDFLKQ